MIASGVDVAQHDRFTLRNQLGHNKFMVRTGAARSTADRVDRQRRLRDAASAFPPALVSANGAAHNPPRRHRAPPATVWYSRTTSKADLAALAEVVAAAKQGIRFLMFMPRNTGVLSNLMARIGQPGFYVRGVVSELPKGRGDESAVNVNVNLVDGAQQQVANLDVVQPRESRTRSPTLLPKSPTNSSWAASVTRSSTAGFW
ncbi:MAG: hypothetical protein QOE41_2437 [Mycobacterium sp.]|nr:Phosphatidylserine/phosphatidylglycerophosphate/cardiolipin synthase [Mycobacterium sp.]MDT5133126.1 hypothetical protein [Mycobacterium sp.]